MKKTIALICALLLVLSLAACGSSASTAATEAPAAETTPAETPSTEPDPTPEAVIVEAVVDPTTISPGTNYSRDLTTSDLWFSTTDPDDYFYLQQGNTDYFPTGLAIYWSVDGTDVLYSEPNAVVDNRLVNEEGSEFEFELAFTDDFTAYDYVSGQWYCREGLQLADVEALFIDQYLENSYGDSLFFNADHTVNDIYYNEESIGIWSVVNATELWYVPDETTGTCYRLSYYLNDDGTLEHIEASGFGSYYVTEKD